MDAEIIAIGDELTSGQCLDTNTQWLSQRCEALGLRVLYHSTVGDALDAMIGVFRQAVGRADVIVATGGLGPTADDLTRQAIAEAAGRELVFDQEAFESIRRLYARRTRRMPEQNRVQAMFPSGSRVIANPEGTAPGIAMDVPREGAEPCRLFALPGVPAEMKEMWDQSVAGALRDVGAGRRVVRHRLVKCFGAGESNVEQMLPDLIRRGRSPRVGITASGATIILRITAEGASRRQCDAAIEPTVATIRQCLGRLVFGGGDDELHHAVARLLCEKGKTLAVCEQGSGGLIAHWFSQIEDAEGRFLGALVAAGDDCLRCVLGASGSQAPGDGREKVAETARRCRERFGADLGLAVGPFPKFDAARADPEPVHFALATAAETKTTSTPYTGHPALLKTLNAKRALNLVRLTLLDAAKTSCYSV